MAVVKMAVVAGDWRAVIDALDKWRVASRLELVVASSKQEVARGQEGSGQQT